MVVEGVGVLHCLDHGVARCCTSSNVDIHFHVEAPLRHRVCRLEMAHNGEQRYPALEESTRDAGAGKLLSGMWSHGNCAMELNCFCSSTKLEEEVKKAGKVCSWRQLSSHAAWNAVERPCGVVHCIHVASMVG